jgi:helicase
MATYAVFVGINKQLDPTIDELTGAKRDALALWALFSDTLRRRMLSPRLSCKRW